MSGYEQPGLEVALSKVYRERHSTLQDIEDEKRALVEELLNQVDTLSKALHESKLDHQREIQFNRLMQQDAATTKGSMLQQKEQFASQMQRQEDMHQDELKRLRASMFRDQFILVLIDGDGMIFRDDLVQRGADGGREAASQLRDMISAEIQSSHHLPQDIKVVVRIYASVNKLGMACTWAGILQSPDVMEQFARGFTGAKQLFDFVDVGMGKDRADDKLAETFKLYLHNCHCRHIYFGGSHDNGYARLLEDVADKETFGKVTLLEGVPFERELVYLQSKYSTTKFGNLFRSEKIENLGQRPFLPASKASNGGLNGHSYETKSSALRGTAENFQPVKTPTGSSWASTAGAAREQPFINSVSPPPESSSSAPQIARNRNGQRLDPPLKVDQTDVSRVKSIKMCVNFYLRNDCGWDPCVHGHDYKPTKAELDIVRYLSRSTPCRFGVECDDPKCIYGHRCPHDVEGHKTCHHGGGCRFGPEMHGHDRKAVRMLKVTGK